MAEAIRRGDADATIAALEAGAEDVQWIAEDVAAPGDPAALDVVREGAVQAGRAVDEAARAGDALAALEAQGRFRILCAHRRGDHGVSTWNTRVEGWLAAALQGFDASTRWRVGRPVLITANDHELRLYNGDAGVAVADGDRVRVAFERRGGVLTVSPARLEAVETLYAMTIHKAQGSQVGTAAVSSRPPSPGSSPASCSTRRSRVRRSASCSSASRRRSARRWRGRSRGRRDYASASGTSADSLPAATGPDFDRPATLETIFALIERTGRTARLRRFASASRAAGGSGTGGHRGCDTVGIERWPGSRVRPLVDARSGRSPSRQREAAIARADLLR